MSRYYLWFPSFCPLVVIFDNYTQNPVKFTRVTCYCISGWALQNKMLSFSIPPERNVTRGLERLVIGPRRLRKTGYAILLPFEDRTTFLQK